MDPFTSRDITCLAVLVCLYSLFDFFLKRLCWKPTEDHAYRAPTLIAQASGLFLTLFIGSLSFASLRLAVGYAVMAALYFLWLYLAGKQAQEEYQAHSLSSFLGRQGLMGIAMLTIWRMALPLDLHDWYASVENLVLSGFGPYGESLREKSSLIFSVIASYLFMIDGGTRIVKGIMGKFPGLNRKVNQALEDLETSNSATAGGSEPEENVGEWIGILERFITLTLVLTGNFGAIAFILTAKSIARFKALEESKDFAEYYLLGTSGSMISALGVGILVRTIFGL